MIKETGKAKTREELLAEERDYKRRRMSYRGKKSKRNISEVGMLSVGRAESLLSLNYLYWDGAGASFGNLRVIHDISTCAIYLDFPFCFLPKSFSFALEHPY